MGINLPVWFLIPAAGTGSRMSGATTSRPKQFFELSTGDWVLESALKRLGRAIQPKGVLIAMAEEFIDLAKKKFIHEFPHVICLSGGKTRQESVARLLAEVPDDEGVLVAVHDAARAVVSSIDVVNVVKCAEDNNCGALLAREINSTVKRVGSNFEVCQTLAREQLWEAETPQVFPIKLLREAHDFAKKSGFQGSDEAQLAEACGQKVRVVPSTSLNPKLTTPVDLSLMNYLARDPTHGKII